MCGIAGIIGVNRSIAGIEMLLDRIRHRGPNGLYHESFGDFAFAHARLSIIDLSDRARQPMRDHSSGNLIIFNGEIYNYLELKSEIGNRYTFNSNSDTEVILAAYKVFGMAFISKLRGMFAFALYDAGLNQVLLVRDRLGIKPLYYRKEEGCFLFASEIKALINIGYSNESVNERKAYEFLADCQLDTDEQTMFNSVKQLPAAHYCWVNAQGVMTAPVSYWQFPEPGKKIFENKDQDDFLEVFNETIRIHLRSDVTLASFLSGGIDSSSICCFALRHLQQENLQVYSAVLPFQHPETALIADVLKTSDRLVPNEFLLDGKGFFDDVVSVIYHHDEPIMDGSMYAHYKLCELAQHNGVKVMLSGSGGDELFGGYSSHIHAHHSRLLTRGKWARYLQDLRQTSSQTSIPYKALLIKSIYDALPVSFRRSLKNNQLRKRLSHLTVKPFIPHYYHEHPDPYHENLLNNYKSWTAPPFLHYEDRNSMAHGVEVRVPYFDHQLIEYIMQFDSECLIQGRSKSLLRNSFRHHVPDPVLDQKNKYGFISPIDHTLKDDAVGREIFYDFLPDTPLLDRKASEKLARSFFQGQGDISVYWRMLSYIMWYQVFFRGWKGYTHELTEKNI